MKKNLFFVMIVAFAMFFALGMPDGAFGVAWSVISDDMLLPLSRATWLIVVHSIFYAVSSSQIGRLTAFFGLDKISAVGLFLLLAAMLGFSFAPNFSWLVVLTGVLGAGMGMIDLGANAFVAKKFSAKHMNWLHCFWGMGGAVSPLIMREMIFAFDWRWGYRAIFAVQIIIFILLMISVAKNLWVFDKKDKKDESKKSDVPKASRENNFLTKKRFRVLQLVIFFLYTSFEYSVTFWTVIVLLQRPGMSFASASLFPAVYLGFLMAGRFIFGFVTDKISAANVIRIGFILSVAGLVTLVFSSRLAGIAMVGFGFAPIFPCLMNETKKRFNPAILSKLVGWQIAAASSGAGISAVVMGRLLDNVSTEAVFPAIIIFVILAFALNEFLEFKLKRVKK
jgi:fucose permease